MKYNHILQIDDDVDDCEMFLEALRTLGNVTYTAIHNSKEAIRKLTSGNVNPDIIILDLNMPMLNGFEILSLLKQDVHLCNIPVIVFSTSSEKATRVMAMEAGAANYITKPHNFPLLQQNIKNFLV